MSTASTSAGTGRSPAPSVSTIRRRVESARTSNTTDSTRDVYTYVYIHFSAFLDVSQGSRSRTRRVSVRNGRPRGAQGSCRGPSSRGTEGDPMERSKRGKETAAPAFPLDEHREDLLLKALTDRAGVAISEIRRGIDGSEEDLPTQDVYIEIARGLEKQEWMLRSHLTG